MILWSIDHLFSWILRQRRNSQRCLKRHLLVLLVPGIEGLLGIVLVLEDTQQVAIAKGINGLKETESAKTRMPLAYATNIYIKCKCLFECHLLNGPFMVKPYETQGFLLMREIEQVPQISQRIPLKKDVVVLTVPRFQEQLWQKTWNDTWNTWLFKIKIVP